MNGSRSILSLLLCSVLWVGCSSDQPYKMEGEINSIQKYAEGHGTLVILFTKSSSSKKADLYIDDAYLGAYSSSQTTYNLPAGWHEVKIISIDTQRETHEYESKIFLTGNDNKQILRLP